MICWYASVAQHLLVVQWLSGKDCIIVLVQSLPFYFNREMGQNG